MEKKPRILFIDRMRALCAYGVILGHLCTWEIASVAPGSAAWDVSNFYNGLMRICVPLFLMISGYLALEQPDTARCRAVSRRSTLRFLADYCFWSACYAAYDLLKNIRGGPSAWLTFLSDVAKGEFHLWYLLMLAGLYALLPVLYAASREKETLYCFLAVSFASTILLPSLAGLPCFAWLAPMLKSAYLDMGFVFYFLAGYGMRKYPPGQRARQVLYVLGLAGAAWSIAATRYLSCREGVFSDFWLSQRSVSVALPALAVFAAAQSRADCRASAIPRDHGRESKLSLPTMGIYTVHVFFLLLLRKFSISTYRYAPVWWLPVLAFAVFLLSLAAARLMRLIPPLRRFL